MTDNTLPSGSFIVTHLEPEHHVGFGVNGFIFHEAGFDTIYRAFNYMDTVLQNGGLNVRLWAVVMSKRELRTKLLHRTMFTGRSGVHSTSGSDTEIQE